MAQEVKFKDKTLRVGDLVKVTQTFIEKEGKKTSSFEGVVISIKGQLENKMFTVRRIGVDGIGIEKIYTLSSPLISIIEVKKRKKVRRAKLYYLRKKRG